MAQQTALQGAQQWVLQGAQHGARRSEIRAIRRRILDEHLR